MLCSPERNDYKAPQNKPTADDANDDWSVDVDVSRYSLDDDETSCVRSEVHSRFSSSYDRDCKQEKYDKSLTYQYYHREDLSYYDTSTYCENSCGDDNVSRLSEPFQHRSRFRDSPFVKRWDTFPRFTLRSSLKERKVEPELTCRSKYDYRESFVVVFIHTNLRLSVLPLANRGRWIEGGSLVDRLFLN